MKVALIFDDTVRPDTTGTYCRSALGGLVQMQHFLPTDLERVPRTGFDLYLNIDDGLEYRLPPDLHPCAWWAIDTHLNLEWCLKRACDFDFVFAAQRDGAEKMQEAGLATACWLPLACAPEIHRPHEVAKSFDVCFVGHLFPGPRTELLQLLQRRFPRNFVGQRFFEEMARTYSASRTVFNRSIRNDINMRVFEGLACGSLLVTNDLRDNGQEDMYQDGVHLATYRDAEELLDKVAFYLARDEVREKVAAAGRAEVLAKDTYRHRMEWLLGEVERGVARKVAATGSGRLGEAKTADVPSCMASGPELVGHSTSSAEEVSEVRAGSDLADMLPHDARKILLVSSDPGLLSTQFQTRQAEVLTLSPEALLRVIGGDPAANAAAPTVGSLDAVVCSDVLEEATEPRLVLRRLSEWLRPEGVVIVQVENLRQHAVLRNLIEGNWGFGQRQLFTRREIEKLFYRANLTVETVRGVPGPDYQEWHERGRPGEVKAGGLHIGGLPADQAEEFHVSHFVVRATPAPAPEHGLTSIVILTHNELAYTRQCVDSIRRFTDEPYELIFVDNASTDGTVEYLRSLTGAKVIVNAENRGFPAAGNQGMQAATGQQILLLNNDVIATTGWLRRLLEALHQDEQIGLVGPCSNYVSGEQRVAITYEHLSELDGFAWQWAKANDQQIVDNDRLVGFCLLLRREVLEKIGLLDEQFGVGCFEDDDYVRRALLAGYRAVIARAAFVHHFGGRTFAGSNVDFPALMRTNAQLYRAKWDHLAPTEAASRFKVRRASTGGLLLEGTRLPLSLCMIVRDNARTIAASLESIRPWVDEMIVVDTGSVDDTPRIAERLGARVFHFPWCDDFSAARNESIKYARGRWIFWMDSDDTISPECGRTLRELVLNDPDPAILGYVVQVHCPAAGHDGMDNVTVVDHVKLFRNLPRLRFDGRIHEQILGAIRLAGGGVAWTDLFVTHSGYDHSPEGQERKKQRDLRILHKELAERPRHPFTLFNLGMTYQDIGEYAKGADFLQRSIANSGEDETHLRKAYSLLVHCQVQLGQAEAAWQTCHKGLGLFPQDEELRFRKGTLLHDAGCWHEAAETYLDLLGNLGERHFTSLDRGITGFKARQNLALVYTDMGAHDRAEEQWRRVIEEVPHYWAGWRGLGECLLRQGQQDEALALADRLAQDSDLAIEGRMLRSQVATARGDLAAARRELEQAVTDSPGATAALEALCRFLFERVDLAEAEGPLEELLRRAPTDGSAYHNLATVYLKTGRPERAREACRRSLEHRPGSAATYLILGYALGEVGHRDEAVAAWEQALRLDPTLTEAQQALVQAQPAAPPRRPAPERTTRTMKLHDKSVEVAFTTRGAVDRSIVEQVWERDVYGVRGLTEAPAVVVDIGAHIGAFAVMAAAAWPEARIIACEADTDNVTLLKENLGSHWNVEVVEAAIVGEDVTRVAFNRVVDKFTHNSGGGSCVRDEHGSVRTEVAAKSVVKLWQEKHLESCDLLKLDCEGAELAVLRSLAEAGLLASVRQIVGEWHAADDRESSRQSVRRRLGEILGATHDVVFGPDGTGREGYVTARLKPLDRERKPGRAKVAARQ